MELPGINKRLKSLIQREASGSVLKFSQIAKIKSSQKVNRLFHLNKDSNKYPLPSIEIILAVAKKYPKLDMNWFIKGEYMKSENIDHINTVEEEEPEYLSKKEAPIDKIINEKIKIETKITDDKIDTISTQIIGLNLVIEKLIKTIEDEKNNI